MALLHHSRAGEPGSETWSSAEVLPRGGGAAWTTGSFDPDLNLIYWGTGNPNPDYYGGDRLGDNLYTSSIVALDADTGKLRWHYQFSPHDTHDWDGNQIPVLADLTIRGQRRRVVMVASRNGFFYVLDRATGELLLGKPFTGTQWAREIGKDGKPIILNLGVVPNDNPNAPTTCVPDLYGGTNFNPPSYDPALDLFFVMARETCALYTPQKQEMQPGRVVHERRHAHAPGAQLQCAASARPEDGRDAMGAESRHAELCRCDVDRVGSRLRRRQRRAAQRVRVAHGQAAVVVSHRIADLRCRANELHARWPAVYADPIGRHHRRVCVAREMRMRRNPVAAAILMVASSCWRRRSSAPARRNAAADQQAPPPAGAVRVSQLEALHRRRPRAARIAIPDRCRRCRRHSRPKSTAFASCCWPRVSRIPGASRSCRTATCS